MSEWVLHWWWGGKRWGRKRKRQSLRAVSTLHWGKKPPGMTGSMMTTPQTFNIKHTHFYAMSDLLMSKHWLCVQSIEFSLYRSYSFTMLLHTLFEIPLLETNWSLNEFELVSSCTGCYVYVDPLLQQICIFSSDFIMRLKRTEFCLSSNQTLNHLFGIYLRIYMSFVVV